MLIRHFGLSVALVITSTALALGCGGNQAPKEEAMPVEVSHAPTISPPSTDAAQATPSRSSDRAMMHLEFVLTSTEPGKAPTSTNYTLNLEEHTPGEIRLGENVPLQTTVTRAPGAAGSAPMMGSMGTPRQDVGMKLKADFSLSADSTCVVHSDFEMSSVDPNPSPNGAVGIRKVSLKGDALVTLGKSSVVATSEDPISHRKLELSVSASKLR